MTTLQLKGNNYICLDMLLFILSRITYQYVALETTIEDHTVIYNNGKQERIQRGGHPPPPPPPPKIGKNMIFLRKIVIFHTKYPKNFRASLRSAQFF